MPAKRPVPPSYGSLSMRKALSMPALLSSVKQYVNQLPDQRQRSIKYSQSDLILSGLAMFSLKDASLLEFDHQRLHPARKHNLSTLFGVRHVPSDTYLRQALDPLEPEQLRPLFKRLQQIVQKQGEMQAYRFLDKYLVSIDGTGQFSSGAVSCPQCCVKQHRDGSQTYYHQLVVGSMVHPDLKTVLPFYPEAITRQDGDNKNDCEHNASRRLLIQLAQDYPQREMIVLQDALACNGPHIHFLQKHGFNFIITAKPSGNSLLLQEVMKGLIDEKTQEQEWTDDKGVIHGVRYANHISLNHEHKELKVNFVDYWEHNPNQKLKRGQAQNKPFQIAFVTDIELNADNIADVVRAGRSRWKIENETFNTLKNLGYNLEHNYGHGKQHLSTVFGTLMLLAFLIDQIQEACCRYFQAARDSCHARIGLWAAIRRVFDSFLVEDWVTLYGAIIWQRAVKLEPVRCRSG